MGTRLLFFILIAASISVSAARAQDRDPISTDRPGFTASPLSVKPGMVQLEGGFLWGQLVGYNFTSGPEILGRVGVMNRVELRVMLPNYIHQENTSGVGDVTVGAKVQLSGEESDVDFAVTGQASLPTGEDPFTADRVEPEIIFTAGTEVSPGLNMGAQGSLKSIEQVGENKILFVGTFILSGAVGNNVSAYGEGVLVSRPGFDAEYLAHFGLMFALSNDLQLDAHGGSGLNETARGVFLGAGMSVRL